MILTFKAPLTDERSSNCFGKRSFRKVFIAIPIGFLLFCLIVGGPPDNFTQLGNAQRSLLAEDPTDYFKDQPDEYYQRLRLMKTRISQGFQGVDVDHPARSLQSSDSPTQVNSSFSSGARSLQNATKVYSFYTVRERNREDTDKSMIRAWEQSWKTAGYDPRVLTTADAAQHPEYAQYKLAMEATLATSSVRKPQELIPCYLRYLAMNVVGGGMMVDLDMTPKFIASESNVTHSTPEKFTVHCNFDTPDPKADWVKQVETQNGLPCAAIAGADEWYRIGKLMGWVAQVNFDQPVWTDAHSLQFMTATGEVKMEKDEVAQSWRPRGWDRCHFRYV